MNRALYRFAILLAFWTLLLIVAGGLVTSDDAGHKALGTLWHICGFSIVTGVVPWFAVRILLHYADHPALRKSALWLFGNVRHAQPRYASQGVAIA
jgi:hypothetical protein